jgi:DNA-binding NarL/FixJ family response regulator
VPTQPRVLLVDDNAELIDRAAAILSPEFLIVGSASDGPAALEAAAALQPDLIVLDISMPGMCGLEVARRLKASGSHAAIVFLTVHEDEEVVSAARNVGGTSYVLKQRLASELLTAVRAASGGRRFLSAKLPGWLW